MSSKNRIPRLEAASSAIAEAQELFLFLNDTAKRVGELQVQFMRDGGLDTWLRIYTHLAFADMEASSYMLKQTALKVAPSQGVSFGATEIDFINETETKKGQIKRKKIPFMVNYETSRALFARAFNFRYAIAVKGKEKLANGIKVRDAMTHPKTIHALRISNEKFNAVNDAMIFYGEETSNLLKEAMRSVK